jgi:pimeloyl-ACP methyl ester carboxylesterase
MQVWDRPSGADALPVPRKRISTLTPQVSVIAFAHDPGRRQALGVSADKAPGRYADVEGIKLYYEIHGSGRPTILLHGGLGATSMFGPNLDALARGRQIIAVDLQGHGRTADVDRPIRVELMARDIAALITHLKLDKPDLVGYSLGGGVAFFAALRNPDLVRRLVIISTPFRRDAYYPDILRQQGQVTAEAAEAMKQTPMYELYASIAPRPQDWGRLLGKIGESMKEDFDWVSELPKLKPQTMIVAGDADIFPPAHATEVFGALGGGKQDGGWDGSGRPRHRLAILPGVTHYAMAVAPALAPTISAFLDEP